MTELTEKMENQDCGEKQGLQAQQDPGECPDSKGKQATLAFPDRRVKPDPQVHPGHLADRDMRVIQVRQDLRGDLDLRATLALQVQLDLQDLQAHQEWV